VTASKPAAGFEQVLYPGQKESQTRQRWRESGIPIADDVWKDFVAAAGLVGVEIES